MEILRFPEAEVPKKLRDQVVALQDQAWPPDDAAAEGAGPIHDPALLPISLLLLDGDRVVSALDILSKELVHAGARLQASGVSTMVTDEAERGKGFGSILVEAARDQMEARRRGSGHLHLRHAAARLLRAGGVRRPAGHGPGRRNAGRPVPERPVRQALVGRGGGSSPVR